MRSGLEPVPRMHNYRGCIFVSFDPEMEAFESYMADALPVLDNTLDLGDMEFAHGQFKYSMRANWKLLVENSMDGYHLAFTHERWVDQWLPSEGIGRGSLPCRRRPLRARMSVQARCRSATGTPRRRIRAPGASHLTRLICKSTPARNSNSPTRRYANVLAPKRAAWSRAAPGTTLIFPNLMVIDGWFVFRTFYPISPDYMEVNAWACLPKGRSAGAAQGAARLVSRVPGTGRLRHPG